MPLFEGLTICSDLKAPAQNNSQGQRWTLVMLLFEGLVMHNNQLNVIQEQLSIELELKTPIVGLHLPKAGWKFVPI